MKAGIYDPWVSLPTERARPRDPRDPPRAYHLFAITIRYHG